MTPVAQRRRPVVRAVIALGANQGDRAATLTAAVAELDAAPGVHVLARSSLYETPALRVEGVDPQAPRYLNAVVVAETALEAHALLDLAHEIEDRHGRVRLTRWGDRTLDLDLIDVGGLTLDDAELTLPHPRAHERAFVLAPWSEVDPEAVLPGRGRVDALLAAAADEVNRRGPFPTGGAAPEPGR